MRTIIANCFFVTITTILLLSCQDVTDTQTPVTKKKKINFDEIQYSVDPSNSNNPWDSAGIYHNLGLDAVIIEPDTLSCNSETLQSQFCWAVSGWKMTWGNNGSLTQDDIYDFLNEFLDEIEVMSPEEMIDEYSSNVEEKGFAMQLLDIILDYTDSTDIAPLINSIKSWETSVTNSFIPDSSKDILLNMGSIARWSTAYWFDEYQLGENSAWNLNCPVNIKKEHNINFLSSIIKIGEVSAADYAGYRVGYAIGSIFGVGEEAGYVTAAVASLAAIFL